MSHSSQFTGGGGGADKLRYSPDSHANQIKIDRMGAVMQHALHTRNVCKVSSEDLQETANLGRGRKIIKQVPKKHDKKNLTRFKRLRTRLSQIILFKN